MTQFMSIIQTQYNAAIEYCVALGRFIVGVGAAVTPVGGFVEDLTDVSEDESIRFYTWKAFWILNAIYVVKHDTNNNVRIWSFGFGFCFLTITISIGRIYA